ncbi:MAG: RluA family pseudouridine synthase [Bacteroidia bacterium]|nr:RluA family pseudouridine synthase [Bacteroidia bacterium]
MSEQAQHINNVYRTLPKAEFIDVKERILYEDNHILIFNKRSGEIVQADKTEDECLSEKLKAFIAQRDSKPGAVFMGVTHRLDRPVSGIVVFAKTSKALSRLNEAFRVGDMHKTYWAVVCNKPKEDEKMLVHYLTRNEKQNKAYAFTQPKSGAKEAKLKYKFLKATDRYFLLEVELYTGRHHQIRVQLASIGCIIKGDLKYGAPRSNKDGSISLHSRSIKFVHPVKKEEMLITAPVFCPVMKSCE